MAGSEFIMYIHPTCATSYSIIKYLYEKDLAGRLRIVNTSNTLNIPGFKIWSVPWITYKGKPIATDPVDGEEVEVLINGGNIEVKDPIEAFMNTILHSVLASAISVLHASIEPVVDVDLINAATRGTLQSDDLVGIIEKIRLASDKLYSEWRDKLVRALAVSFVRDAWWGSEGELDSEQLQSMASGNYISAWLIAKAGIGRVALPDNPLRYDKEAVKIMSKFISSNARGLIRKIEREQEMILSDHEYWEVIKRASKSIQ
ncbi:MAG: hypothetical protein GSR85_04640 [Desulfurococcales archaeon]|nr:hypothetical protein [Desulfurococcales archaeon]